MITLALIGAGRIGRLHAANIAAHPGAALICVADIDSAAANALAACHNTVAAPVDSALEGPADAVLIASSTDTHAMLIERAAAAGKAIFCEKPIDLDLTRARRAVACAEKAGVPLAVGFNRRFDPNFAALKARLDAGEIGELEMLSIISRDPAPPPIAYIRVSGGLFKDMMIHDLDMARWLLGEPIATVHAAGSVLVDPAIGKAGDIDSAVVILRTGSGRLAQISNSRRAVYGYDQRIECLGSKGLIAAGNLRENTIEVAAATGYRRAPLMHFFLQRYAQAYAAEIAAFIQSLEHGDSMTPDGLDGIAALALAAAAQSSFETGMTIHVA